MSKTFEINIKKLQDTTGSKQDVKKMKLGAIFYLKQLGFNQYDISTMIDIKRPTVQSIISRVNQTGTTLTGKSTGRPSAFDDYTQRHLERTIRRDPFQTLETITGQLRMMGKNVSRSTTRKWVGKLGFRYYTPAVKPKMNEEHKKNRLEWAHLHKNWSIEQWRQVIWSDESRFRVSGNDGTPLVLRKEGERYESCHTLRSVKFGGGSLMVWSCFWAGGLGPLVFIDGNMNQESYIDVLSQYYIPWVLDLYKNEDKVFTFQEDNATCHTGAYAKWWKRSYSMNVMEKWPAQSPDLNPIEHVWSELARKLRRRKNLIHNTEELRRELLLAWENIDVEFTAKLIESMPKRCQAVIDSKGDVTKY
ncbi:hypothetical protein INT46_009433 [Mucor plumbeus]|uniref:Transposase n=1 Tax=Mucor plumbeus TaxID=97098 RepID=A0A8H7RJD7_9FUNG|nr:hypothetical protein INT46_009433 [Mucor plumbeus]